MAMGRGPDGKNVLENASVDCPLPVDAAALTQTASEGRRRGVKQT